MGGLFSGGILGENPLLRLGLGLCPALAVTTTAMNGLGMGITTGCVLVCVSLIASIFGYFTADKGRVAVFMMLSAAFAGVAQMVLKGWYPQLAKALGVYVPLIAVNCMILGRADFAADNGPVRAVADALGMGIGYTCAMTVVGIVRELLASGSVFGAKVLPAGFEPVQLIGKPAGAFLVLGLLMGIFNLCFKNKKKEDDQA